MEGAALRSGFHMLRGWGCGYRTLQSLCSFIHGAVPSSPEIPSIPEIQRVLVNIEDKPEDFLGSKNWIGTVESGLIIDSLYNVPCKIIHVNTGKELSAHVNTIKDHFYKDGCPIMMGGESDTASKMITGVRIEASGNLNESSLLIVDPHYVRDSSTKTEPEFLNAVYSQSYVSWISLEKFEQNTFYNLCIPQCFKKKR